MVIATLPRRIPLSARRRYSLSGILVSLRAGVYAPEPPPPRPLPVPPAPVPLPASAAPEVDALPVPATFAAGSGERTGNRGGGATTGEGSAFFAGAPAGSFICCGLGAGGGFTGGGGGTSITSKVRKCSIVSPT